MMFLLNRRNSLNAVMHTVNKKGYSQAFVFIHQERFCEQPICFWRITFMLPPGMAGYPRLFKCSLRQISGLQVSLLRWEGL